LSKGRLTRHELSWLLTQEAQNAAERLRLGVKFLRTQAPPAPSTEEDPAHGVETSLDALDDVMKMLSNLNQKSTPATAAAPPARRGRIDIAAIVVEAAPEARVSFEPGSGTEIYGDEADLRRMIQVLIGHGSGEGAAVTVRREGDEVKVSVALGPDSSPTAETERAWLARVAMRYGGRHELEGGSEVLVFPADGASDRNESAALRKELDEARKQGEVYARELAAIFDRGEEVTALSTIPPATGVPSDARLAILTKLCAGVASEIKNALGAARDELAAIKRTEGDDPIDPVRRRVSHTLEIVSALASIGELRAGELDTEVELGELVKTTVKSLAPLAERDGVNVVVRTAPEGARPYVRRGSKAIGALVRELVGHAIEASPRDAHVDVTLNDGDGTSGPRLVVDDAGSPLPASGRRSFLTLETHAGAYGRPSGLPIFLAAELAACQGATLELSDAPSTGGLRVTVTFSKT
jgi:two-component system, OmpR family, sensor kinase